MKCLTEVGLLKYKEIINIALFFVRLLVFSQKGCYKIVKIHLQIALVY